MWHLRFSYAFGSFCVFMLHFPNLYLSLSNLIIQSFFFLGKFFRIFSIKWDIISIYILVLICRYHYHITNYIISTSFCNNLHILHPKLNCKVPSSGVSFGLLTSVLWASPTFLDHDGHHIGVSEWMCLLYREAMGRQAWWISWQLFQYFNMNWVYNG